MRRFLTGWLVCALLCTLCACENAAGQADLQSIQKADVRELYEALYSDVAEAEDTYVGKSYGRGQVPFLRAWSDRIEGF